MNLPFEKSPGFCSVRLMDSFEFEFGGVKVLGAGEKTGRAGWSQPSAEVVVGAALPVRVNQGPRPFLRQNQPSRRSAELRRQSHPVPAKSSWQLSPGVLKFSAESINGMNLAALSTLHQLPVVNALRIQGAWPHAIEDPGNHLAILGGGGSQQKGAPGMGPNIHPGAQAGCLVLLAGECLCQRGTWKSALVFSTLEILFRICPHKGCRVGLIARP